MVPATSGALLYPQITLFSVSVLDASSHQFTLEVSITDGTTINHALDIQLVAFFDLIDPCVSGSWDA